MAKTISSAKAENIFFYAKNAEGKSVLLKVMRLSELKTLAHGQKNGKNYFISTTDNYTATQYCEGRGFTVEELLSHVKQKTTVSGADKLRFSGSDTLHLMATDSYGNYSRSWMYDELYGVKRYYFEGRYDSWNTGWETAGEDSSKFGISLAEYNRKYKDKDPYYDAKRKVFDGGTETTVVLMTESFSGRTTSDTLTASTEPGIASYIKKNGGTVAGCLKNALTDEYALRLSLPMTEADLMTAHRTAYDNFKWIYNLRLDMAKAPLIASKGTVTAPEATFQRNGNQLTITFKTETPGASIYYSFDGAPQIRYTGPVTLDITGQNLDSQPVTVYAAAVKEGWDDAGVQSYQYPQSAPAFQTVYTAMTGAALQFTAAKDVTDAQWSGWTKSLQSVRLKAPKASGYQTLAASKYSISGKTITFDKSLFPEAGSYSFLFSAGQYANKDLSVTMKNAAPVLQTAASVPLGEPIKISFADEQYQKSISVYVTPQGGSRTMISSNYLDRTVSGSVTIKAEYSTAASTAMGKPGSYTLELVNNAFAPASQTVSVTLTEANGFIDVPANAWYSKYVMELSEARIISGMTKTTFQPEGKLTWGQAMKLLMLSTGFSEQKPTGSHWASGYMDKAKSSGLISGTHDPDARITRLEFCRAAAKAMNAKTKSQVSPFTDCKDPGVKRYNFPCSMNTGTIRRRTTPTPPGC